MNGADVLDRRGTLPIQCLCKRGEPPREVCEGLERKEAEWLGRVNSAEVTDEEIEGADVGESVNCSYRVGIRAAEADTAWARRDRELRRRFAGAMPRKLAAERRENMRRFPDPE